MGSRQKFLSLFRSFFPSWQFFNEVGSRPRLLFQVASTEEPWQPALVQSERSLGQIFINSEENFYHASNSLIERLLVDASLMDVEQIESSTSYQLVENLVRFQILEKNPTLQGQKFQFKISVRDPETSDALISQMHEL